MNSGTARPASPRSGFTLSALALGSALLLAGCAGNPPTEQFAVSNTVLKSAAAAGATEYAPVELRTAQEKMTRAESLAREEDYEEARRLAEQAEWDARVAERKALAAKAEKAYQDSQQGIQDLRDEGQRSTIIVK